MSRTDKSTAPATWPTVELREVAESCLGKMLDAQKNKGTQRPYLRNPNVRWFDVDLSDLRTMPFEDHELDRFGLIDGDVVICEGGEAGRAAIWRGQSADMKFQKAIHRVRTGPRLFNRFLVHQLKAAYEDGSLAEYYTGATIKHLTGQDLARYRIPLPPLAEQRRIAEVLDRAETLRAQRRQALVQLDALAEAIFLDMFGDAATNPQSLPRVALGELICSGPQNGLYKPSSDYGSGTPILRIDAFYDGAVTKLETLKRVRVSDVERVTFGLEPDDIVINRVNSPEYLGKSALIPALSEPTVFESNMMRFRLDAQRILPGYAMQCLQSPFIRAQIRTASKDAVNQSSINQQDVKGFLINLPPLAEQRKFVARIAKVGALRCGHRESQSKLDTLFTSLQHRAFRGEL